MEKCRRGLSEGQLAVLLVAPALILVILVSLYPIARTFYLSLFDLKLNEPAKNDTYFSYQINLERYADIEYRVNNSLKKAARNMSAEDMAAVEKVRLMAEETNEAFLETDDKLHAQYDKIYDLQENLQKTPAELKYILVPEKVKLQLMENQSKLLDVLAELKKNNISEEQVNIAYQAAEDISSTCISPNFTGLGNYISLFKENRLFSAIGFTLQFTVITVFCELCLGLFLANIMTKSIRGRGIVRASILIPWGMPAAVCAMTWRYLYDGQYGIVAKLFSMIGLISDPGLLLTTKGGALFSLAFADIWKTTPFMALLILAGQQTIDGGILEAAFVDGANRVQRYFKIVLKLLKPTILVALLFRTLDAFRVYDLVAIMTNGAPSNSTETLTLYAYKSMFSSMQMGFGSAIAIITFLCVALICIFYIRILGANVLEK